MKHKILVVEDTTEVRENIAEILTLSGYDVETAPNGKVGIRTLDTFTPDLILCDVLMPELDGLGMLKIVSQHKVHQNIPFIFLTAKSEQVDIRKGMELGADDYIVKPFGDLALLNAIETRIKKHQRVNTLSRDTLLSSAKLDKSFHNLLENKELRKYGDKDVIYEHSSHPRWIYYLEEGLIKHVYTNDIGKEIILEVWKKGQLFGLEAPYMDNKYFGSAIAFGPVSVRMIKLDEFKKAIIAEPNLSDYLITTICHRKRNYAEAMGLIAYSSVRKKVASSLVFFAELYDSQKLAVSREDLASKATTAKETLIRALSDFKAEKLIRIEKGIIHIDDIEALRRIPT